MGRRTTSSRYDKRGANSRSRSRSRSRSYERSILNYLF